LFPELTSAQILKQPQSLVHRIHKQLGLSVAIQITQHTGRGKGIGTTHTCLSGDILELPIAQIAKQLVGGIQGIEIQITTPISIDITRRDARAVQEHLVGHMVGHTQMIREGNTRFGCWHQTESGLRLRR